MAIILDGNNTPTLGGVGYGDGTELAFTSAGSAGGVLYSAGGAAPVFSAAGLSGQLLQSNGASAPTWTTVSSGSFGTDLSYVDYLLTTSSRVTSSTNAGFFSQPVSLDGTSELFIIHGSASAHAVVYNTSTSTFGTPILVRTASLGGINCIAVTKVSSTAVLVCSLPNSNTALQTVVLTVSGSTITVGTAVATTLAGASTLVSPNTRLVTVDTSYVLNYFTTSDNLPKFRAITVSGSTPSIGSELAYAGGTASSAHHSYAHSASILLHFSFTSSSTVYVLPITVSGTTLTAGTQATVSTTASSIVTGALSNSRYALVYRNTTGRGAVVSVAGSVATISTAVATMAVGAWQPLMQVTGNQAFILTGLGSSDNVNLLTDTAGVASLGTDYATNIPTAFVGYLSTGKVFLAPIADGNSSYYQLGISAGSVVVEKSFENVTDITAITARTQGTSPYSRPLSGPPQSGSGNIPMLRTSAGKIVSGTAGYSPFSTSIDGTYPAKLQQSANPYTAFNDGISEAVGWGFPTSQDANTTTVQLRKVTLV